MFDNPNPFTGLLGIASCLLIKSLCLANDFLYEIGGRNSNSLNELVFSSKANKKIIYTG